MPNNLFYLTDFWGAGAAIVHSDRTVLVTSPLEADRAEELGNEIEVVQAKKWAEVPAVVMKQLGGGRALVDSDTLFRKAKGFEPKPDLFLEARRVKDEMEVSRIMRASEGQDRIFRALEGEIRPGRTEWEVAAEVLRVAALNGLTPSGSDSALSPTIVAAGENGALPHAELTSRRIRKGDFVVVDLFFRYKGYNSDETRTFAVGGASADMKRKYRAVLEAQENALELVRVGSRCCDVNNEAVRTLRRYGLDRYLNHSVGHGVGIDIHEMPGINKDNRSELEKGEVVTDEPGIYLRDKFGIRIEDTVKVDKRPVPLTHYTEELVTVA